MDYEKKYKKEYTFKAIPRLLEMVEPTNRAKAYCQKLIDSLTKEGYVVDAKIVGECFRQMNGEDVPMATMDEQKPIDKAEPKFKNGQWIVWQNKCYEVNYNGCGYELIDQNGLRTSLEYGTVDKSAHLWTIQDAKDGDLIYVSTEEKGIQAIFHEYKNGTIFFHCYLCINFTQGGYMPIGDVDMVHPLQKIHHKRFFEKMHEAGYTFDFDKKELNKIDNK